MHGAKKIGKLELKTERSMSIELHASDHEAVYLHIEVNMTVLSYTVLKPFLFRFTYCNAYYTKCISNMYLIIGVCKQHQDSTKKEKLVEALKL